jgi:RNA polymerase primary sigma factor
MRQLKINVSITNRTESSLDKYLSDISKLQMIDANQEVELTKLVKKGDIVALQKMVKSNLRFVVSVAKQFQHQGMSLSDLINEGNIGLIKAAQKFDETKGFKFISYAVWWIRQSIMMAIAENSRCVRLPINQINMIGKINKFIMSYEQEFEKSPTIDEIAKGVDISSQKVSDILAFSNRNTISLDNPFDSEDSDSNNLLDIYVDSDVESTDQNLIKESLSSNIKNMLNFLPKREKQIIEMHFGIGFDREHTLDEIALNLNLTKERVRQIKEKTIRSLRQNKFKKVLYC